jgi:mannose-1-phosphate guanylyltransferase/mannose-6-phosphate isomerase
MIRVIPVILTGGSGARLWPLSRKSLPKQFLEITGSVTLFQATLNRIFSLRGDGISIESPVVVANEEHAYLVMQQLLEINQDAATICLEPEARGTATALTSAALEISEEFQDSVMLVMPADHVIKDFELFEVAVMNAIAVAASGSIVTLGVKPRFAATGYGYIKAGIETGLLGESTITEFVEKPESSLAEEFFTSNKYFWNSGIFVLRPNVWLDALLELRPDIFHATIETWKRTSRNGFFRRFEKDLFSKIPIDSIDYAVLQKISISKTSAKMVALESDWRDLGSWDSIADYFQTDPFSNGAKGDVVLNKCTGTYALSESRLVVGLGLENLVIVETSDAVLVVSRDESQALKAVVDELDFMGRTETTVHRRSFRPWGWFDLVEQGDSFKIKKIRVNPHSSLSLQYHRRRAEHWTVIKGIAHVTNGDEELVLQLNESTFIPKGQRHRLTNCSNDALEIIEIQTGDYFGEDDIVRLDDHYGRVNKSS